MANERSSHPFKLPGFLQLKQTPNEGRGLFAKKRIRCSEDVVRCKPYTVGVSATTTAGLKEVCHQCAKSIPTLSSAVVCDRCQIVAYCCKSCQDDALPVHRVECQGLRDLEKLRGKEEVLYKTYSECTLTYWPPAIVLLTTRALNRKVMEMKSTDEWEIASLSKPDKLPPSKEDGFKVLLPYMWPLVLTSITTEEMLYDAFCRTSISSSGDSTHAGAVYAECIYAEFSLFNHCCVPNCYAESEDGVKVVCALRDIEVGEQLCISYIREVHRLLPGEFRRRKLMEVFGFKCMCTVCLEERDVGSKTWYLEKQKHLFIAPWSCETANCAMEEGRKALMRLIQLQENEDWERVVKEGHTELKKHKGVLDDRNIIYYLLSKALLEAYVKLDQPKNGLQMADVLLKSADNYELQKDVHEVLMLISLCHFKTGSMEMGRKLVEKAMKHFPVMLTPGELSGIGIPGAVAPPLSGRKLKVNIAKLFT